MKDWQNRSFIHRDGNSKCIKISKSHSVGFDVFIFKLKFITLFRYKKSNKSWQNGSMWWETLSIKDKIISKNHGLRKLFAIKAYRNKSWCHGVNTFGLDIFSLPLRFYKYYDEVEESDITCIQVSKNSL